MACTATPTTAEAPPVEAASPEVTPEQTNAEPTPHPIEPEGPGVSPPRPGGGLSALTQQLVDDTRRRIEDPTRLVPSEATFLLVMLPGQLAKYEPAADVWGLIESKQPDMRDDLAGFRACVGEPSTVERLTVAFDNDNNKFVAIEAPKIGTADTWACLAKEAKGRGDTWDNELTDTPRGKGPQLRTKDKDVGYFVHDDMVVVASEHWSTALDQRLSATADAAAAPLSSPLDAPRDRVDTTDPLWLAGVFPSDASTAAKSILGTPLSDIALSIGPDNGDARFRFSFAGPDRTTAEEMRTKMSNQLDQMRAVFPMFGFPSTVPPKLSFETEGDLVVLNFSLTPDEIEGFVEGVGKL